MFLRDDLLLEGSARRERVADVLERRLDGLLILRDRDILLDLRQVQVGDVGAASEDRQADARFEGPLLRAVAEQPR